MEVTSQIRTFLSSQNLYTGIRMTAGALIPAFILYHNNLLVSMMAFPLGAMFTGLTDSPGPVRHRLTSLGVSKPLAGNTRYCFLRNVPVIDRRIWQPGKFHWLGNAYCFCV
jgi:hypothetical protein